MVISNEQKVLKNRNKISLCSSVLNCVPHQVINISCFSALVKDHKKLLKPNTKQLTIPSIFCMQVWKVGMQTTVRDCCFKKAIKELRVEIAKYGNLT